MAGLTFDDLRDQPFREHAAWTGGLKSLDGTEASQFTGADIATVLYSGQYGADEYDGAEAFIAELKDGRLVAWQTWWGPTGAGFSEDAYGGEADIWFASKENLSKLILQALDNQGRDLCGIPLEGLVA